MSKCPRSRVITEVLYVAIYRVNNEALPKTAVKALEKNRIDKKSLDATIAAI